MKRLLVLSAAALAVSGGAAFADMMASASTNLNVRAGPGSNYPVVGTVAAGQSVAIDGCLNAGKWCKLTGTDGWVSARFLGGIEGAPVVAFQGAPATGTTTVIQGNNVDDGATGAITGGAAGAIAGGVLGGPAGAAIGGVAGFVGGGAVGTAIDPPARVRTYVTANRVQPVTVQSRVAIGTTLPSDIELRTIPDYEYRYAYINDQPVLVEPSSRRIVYVY